MKATPVGAAQKKVLDALNMTATDWNDANEKFKSVGITVGAKRVGKTSEPIVSMMDTVYGGWNRGGDGESYERKFDKVDLSPVAQWIE